MNNSWGNTFINLIRNKHIYPVILFSIISSYRTFKPISLYEFVWSSTATPRQCPRHLAQSERAHGGGVCPHCQLCLASQLLPYPAWHCDDLLLRSMRASETSLKISKKQTTPDIIHSDSVLPLFLFNLFLIYPLGQNFTYVSIRPLLFLIAMMQLLRKLELEQSDRDCFTIISFL